MILLLALLAATPGGADLKDLARKTDLTWSADPGTGRHTIKSGNLTIVVVPGMRQALVDGMLQDLEAPVRIEGGALKLPPSLLRRLEAGPPKVETPLVEAPKAGEPRAFNLPACKIVIDPGHGGRHTGGKGRYLMEKDINLDVSLEMARLLRSWGAEVIMTRVTDRHLAYEVSDDLNRRVDIVNQARPDLFLSIHVNYVGSPGPRGYEVWVPKGIRGTRDRLSREIAWLARSALKGVLDTDDRGTKDTQNLRVLRGTRCPAALVELEFVSNPQAERELGRRSVRLDMARGLAEAAARWLLKNAR